MVEALEEEIPAHQETDCVLETALVPSVGNEKRMKMMDTCDRGWRGGQYWQKEKSENSQGKDLKTFSRKQPGEGPKYPGKNEPG